MNYTRDIFVDTTCFYFGICRLLGIVIRLQKKKNREDKRKDMEPIIFGVCLVDFHHKRGPEVEYWYGLPEGVQEDQLWTDLPFQALPDGSHSFEETFTYFTLLYNKQDKSSYPNDVTEISEDEMENYTTLYAISCSQQIKSDELLIKDESVTRSTVQKAIVVISFKPILSQIKEKLSIVTNVFFMQHDFTDKKIINTLYDSLISTYNPTSYKHLSQDNDNSQIYMGIHLQNLLITHKRNLLVLLKALLLERKIIVYGNHVENICNLQFGLISLIPELIFNLDNSISPQLYDKNGVENGHVVDSFKSSDKKSVYRFLGLPLQIFEKGGLFSPYTPLQQIGNIKSDKTKFFMIGTSNSLLYEQRDQLCEIFVNMDENSIEILNKDLQSLLTLSHYDKKWIDSIVDIVNSSEASNNISSEKLDEKCTRITNISYEGSDDFLRSQFEEYLYGLLSSVKLYEYLNLHEGNEIAMATINEDMIKSRSINTFNINWVKSWLTTQNFQIFNNITDDRIFDLFPPRHVYNGVDPFTLFQQRFLNTLQNFKRSTASRSKESINGDTNSLDKNDDKQDTENDNSLTDVSNKSEANSISRVVSGSQSVSNSSEVSNTQSQPSVNNIWSQWKDYFRRDKKEQYQQIEKHMKDDDRSNKSENENLKEEEDIYNTNKNVIMDNNMSYKSTRNVFENALLGLGIHVNKRQDEIDSGKEMMFGLSTSNDNTVENLKVDSNVFLDKKD